MKKIIISLTAYLLLCSTSTTAQFGKALVLNGCDDYLEIPDNDLLDYNQNLSVEAWVQINCTAGTKQIVGKQWCSGSDFGYSVIDRATRLDLVFSESGGCPANVVRSQNPELIKDEFVHFAVVHTRTETRMYINGNLLSIDRIVGNHSGIHNSSAPFRIGAYRSLNGVIGLFYSGLIDELRVWNIALDETLIKQRMNAPLSGNEPGLVLYLDMEDSGQGSSLVLKNKAATGASMDARAVGFTANTPYLIEPARYDEPPFDLGQDIDDCVSSSVELSVGSRDYKSVRWSNGSTGRNITVTASGTYWAEVETEKCKIFRDEVSITIGTNETIVEKATICEGESYRFYDKIYAENGIYFDTVNVTNGCDTFLRLELEVIPNDLVLTSRELTPAVCPENNGSINLDVEGAAPPFNYEWDGPSAIAADVSSPNGLAPGWYYLTITDSSPQGCGLLIDTFLVTQLGGPEVAIDFVQDIDCYGGEGTIGIEVRNRNNNQIANIEWSGPTAVSDNTSIASGLAAGRYSITVTDTANCVGFASQDLVQPDSIQLRLKPSEFGEYNVSCHDSKDGRVETMVNGGTLPYQLLWSTGADSSIIKNLSAPQDISLTVTDKNGCVKSDSISLTAPDPIFASTATKPVGCEEFSRGTIAIDSISGGSGVYTFSLNDRPFAAQDAWRTLTVGNYTIHIMDNQACSLILYDSVLQADTISVDLGEDEYIELGDEVFVNPKLNLQLGIDTFYWILPSSYNEISPDPLSVFVDTPMDYTRYYLFVQDENGCYDSDFKDVFVSKPREIYVPNVFSPNDDGINDFFFITTGNDVAYVHKFQIFDRWGELIHAVNGFLPSESQNPDIAWDGTFNSQKLNAAVYIYMAEIEFIDGRVVVFKGDVSLVR